jgi:hypothetical protein
MSGDRDELIDRIAAQLRGAPPVLEGLAARVMARVRAEPRPRTWRAALAGLVRPREVWISPLGGLAMAAGVALLMVSVAVFSPGRPGLPVAGPAAGIDTLTPVQFVLVAPAARSVALVGDFTDWALDAVPLRRDSAAGVWEVTVPLAPGRYRYTFLVNGESWVADPAAPATGEDDFGRPSSIITVGGVGS